METLIWAGVVPLVGEAESQAASVAMVNDTGGPLLRIDRVWGVGASPAAAWENASDCGCDHIVKGTSTVRTGIWSGLLMASAATKVIELKLSPFARLEGFAW